MRRIRDVPDLEAVEAALDDVVPEERLIGVDALGELLGGLRERQQPHVPGRFAGVIDARLETDTWIRRRGARGRHLLRVQRQDNGRGDRERRNEQSMGHVGCGLWVVGCGLWVESSWWWVVGEFGKSASYARRLSIFTNHPPPTTNHPPSASPTSIRCMRAISVV